MAKEEPLKFEGQVVTIHPGDKFDVKLDQNDHVVKCTLSGKMRKNSIKVIPNQFQNDPNVIPK